MGSGSSALSQKSPSLKIVDLNTGNEVKPPPTPRASFDIYRPQTPLRLPNNVVILQEERQYQQYKKDIPSNLEKGPSKANYDTWVECDLPCLSKKSNPNKVSWFSKLKFRRK
jgi:hypothetical protein